MWKQFVMTHRKLVGPEDDGAPVERFFEVPPGQSVHKIVDFRFESLGFAMGPSLVLHVQMTTNQPPTNLSPIVGEPGPTQHSVWLAYEVTPLDGQRIGPHIGTVVYLGKHLHAFKGRETL